MTTFTHLAIEIDDEIAVLRIGRADASQTLDRRVNAELMTALAELADREDVGAVILTGAGERVFAAGADIRQLRDWTVADALAGCTSAVCTAIERLPKPTIAAVNGTAVGGGCELALACDLRIAADHVRFGQPEVGLGIIPAAGGTQRLPRIIGLGRAKEMVLTGDPIDAPTALAWGLVSLVVPSSDLMSTARRLARRMLTRGPLAIQLAKAMLNASAQVGVDGGLLMERLAQAICYASDDKREGTSAFLEKRSPIFRGRVP
jgi:enoyl-CoA hydratase